LSFGKLSHKYNLSKTRVWNICHEELQKLPNNNQFSFSYCSRYSAIFAFDGKYLNVKGFAYKPVLLWGLDYFRHDIPVFDLNTAENYHSWARFFSFFRLLNHRPQLIVCDDNYNLKLAARNLFPSIKIQTCVNHYKENIRRQLQTRSNPFYRQFSKSIDKILSQKLSQEVFNKQLLLLYQKYGRDQVAQQVLLNIHKNQAELLAYRGIHQAPLTSNIIESFNSHLQSRLFSLKSFNSLKHAKLWLNGYVLKRRMTKFTGCNSKFRYLNDKTGVMMTKKPGVDIPSYF